MRRIQRPGADDGDVSRYLNSSPLRQGLVELGRVIFALLELDVRTNQGLDSDNSSNGALRLLGFNTYHIGFDS